MVESTQQQIQDLADLANVFRIDVIESIEQAKSGHPTSCSSSAELLAVLFFHESGMHYDPKNPKNFANDKFILSKGHNAPILYVCWVHNGFLPKESLKTLRHIDSKLEGHPVPRLDFVDIASGSLGQGLSVAAGMAYASKYMDKIQNKFYALLGDGECAEGSVWEAANFAGYYNLSNLVAIVDVNALGQSQATMQKHETEVYAARFQSFGWETICIDGHDVAEVIKAYTAARNNQGQKPFAILAKTFKGKNFTEKIENQLNWHGKPLGNSGQEAIVNIRKLIKNPDVKLTPTLPSFTAEGPQEIVFTLPENIEYDPSKPYATRQAYGNALKRIVDTNNKTGNLISLDGDTKNSTFAQTLFDAYPQNFVEGFIAEQNLVGVAQGISIRRRVPFVSAFAAFFTRAFDQMRMGSISHINIKYVGSHCGVSIGEDGASQMALEDLAQFRTFRDGIVLYPSDAISTEHAVLLAANHKGPAYIRTSRPATPILYKGNEKFEIGKSKVYVQTDKDVITLIGCAITFSEGWEAVKKLAGEGIHVRLIDLFSVKPLDVETLTKNIRETQGRCLIVEDHYREGGIFEAVASELASEGFKFYSQAVDRVPPSGKPHELVDLFGLSAAKIEARIREIIKQ